MSGMSDDTVEEAIYGTITCQYRILKEKVLVCHQKISLS